MARCAQFRHHLMCLAAAVLLAGSLPASRRETLPSVRGVSLYTPESRAPEIEQRIRTIAARRAAGGLLKPRLGVGITVMIYACLSNVLALFAWTRGFGRRLFAIALDPMRTMGSGLPGIVANLVFPAFLAVVIRYRLKAIHAIFDGAASGTVSLNGFDPNAACRS